MSALGTLEDLPLDYRNVLPHDAPNPATKPCLWSFERIRPLLLRAGELTPVEKAERRVLVLTDPGRGQGAMQVTSSIYVGLQLLLPGGKWHDHGHDGTEPVIWLDALDLPLFVYLEGSYAETSDFQAPRNRSDAS